MPSPVRFWFVAFICFIYADVLEQADSDFHKTYHEVSESVKPVTKWLAEQFNRVLAEEKAEFARISSQMNRRDPNQA
jgi:phosphatidylserine/phosphatidylglycerophosphate/cardiolipin synthase-like enzyme